MQFANEPSKLNEFDVSCWDNVLEEDDQIPFIEFSVNIMINILKLANKNDYLKIAQSSYIIYYCYSEDKGNAKQEFMNYCNKKLDKWINKTKE